MCVFSGVRCGAVEMNMLKSVGESGDPCGTPCVGVICSLESVLSMRVLIILFVKNEWMILVKC